MVRSVGGVFICLGLAAPGIARADAVTDWNGILLNAVRTTSTNPPAASRAMACVHIAIYDAVNAIDGSHEPYLVTSSAPEGTSMEAAVAAAAHGALVVLFPTQQETLDAALEASLSAIADGAAKDNGIALGELCANDVLAARANDHSTDVVGYTPGTEPGDWQPTPPALAAALLPQWPTVTPFAMTSGSQFRSGGPPALDSAEYAAAFSEVKAIGRVDSATRTEEQTAIARFWANGGGTSTPPGHWNQITQVVAEAQGNTLVENARLFALLNMALADAAIVSWDNKYAYNHWRPVTAIPAADSDGNDATEPDAEWLPLLTTPPFPDYTSGHSTFSGAAAKVLEGFYGTDDIEFTVNSDGTPDVFRTFTSFSQAAQESADSRMYAGIHWRYANQDGLAGGQNLGAHVSANFLKEVDGGDGDGDGGPRVCGLLGAFQAAGLVGLLLVFRAWPHRRRK
jgi:hypothetical protein